MIRYYLHTLPNNTYMYICIYYILLILPTIVRYLSISSSIMMQFINLQCHCTYMYIYRYVQAYYGSIIYNLSLIIYH